MIESAIFHNKRNFVFNSKTLTACSCLGDKFCTGTSLCSIEEFEGGRDDTISSGLAAALEMSSTSKPNFERTAGCLRDNCWNRSKF